jgi:primosomal protein N'
VLKKQETRNKKQETRNMKQEGEVVMLTKAIHGRWSFCSKCPQCRNDVIAPVCSAYVSEDRVDHSWSCEYCEQEFETSIFLATEAIYDQRRRAFATSLVT